jgi:hypothetical protein
MPLRHGETDVIRQPQGFISLRTLPRARGASHLQHIEFHYTPKHASWLNMVEIEIGVLRGQCLIPRLVDQDR